MRFATERDQRLDLGRCAALDVGLARVPAVGEQLLDTTERLGQDLEPPEHRRELLLSLAACVTALATISRLSVVTTAWAF